MHDNILMLQHWMMHVSGTHATPHEPFNSQSYPSSIQPSDRIRASAAWNKKPGPHKALRTIQSKCAVRDIKAGGTTFGCRHLTKHTGVQDPTHGLLYCASSCSMETRQSFIASLYSSDICNDICTGPMHKYHAVLQMPNKLMPREHSVSSGMMGWMHEVHAYLTYVFWRFQRTLLTCMPFTSLACSRHHASLLAFFVCQGPWQGPVGSFLCQGPWQGPVGFFCVHAAIHGHPTLTTRSCESSVLLQTPETNGDNFTKFTICEVHIGKQGAESNRDQGAEAFVSKPYTPKPSIP
ncbi:hypothetical protein DUNSADRAFT_12932 [Dunaliella salina]|uniref:Encoded protein n=1 Tax=Dunaliella salina TaxID=3046 RepID=A0ABQ7GAH4_DUNSA|nr:hypothetical protein DUNSADRAFT_12932 [Dunaliella salina]|eukprot:KAF5831598.1 hypothetical protein DUNSADRAFT_12932 [Dunaliella salina]